MVLPEHELRPPHEWRPFFSQAQTRSGDVQRWRELAFYPQHARTRRTTLPLRTPHVHAPRPAYPPRTYADAAGRVKRPDVVATPFLSPTHNGPRARTRGHTRTHRHTHMHGHGPGASWLAPDASCGGLCPTITSAPRSTSRPCSGASLMSPGIMQALLQTACRRGTLSYNQGSCIDATTSLTPLLHGSWLVALVVG